jgi:NAD+ diphosphatase
MSDERWLLVRRGEVLVLVDGGVAHFPGPDVLEEFDDIEAAHVVGRAATPATWAAGVPVDAVTPLGHEWMPLRSLYAAVDELEWMLAGRAVQIVEWSRTHRYCGRCGAPTDRVDGERAMGCPACGLLAYPRLSPAVIMVVHRGDDLLLARGRLFETPIYSALAGFVEPGESLEGAVRREVREEVGVEVGELRYFGSQPWPFPNSLMIGFFAEWASGEIAIDPTEIVDAQWFHYDSLPTIPGGGMSIASRLISAYVDSRRK